MTINEVKTMILFGLAALLFTGSLTLDLLRNAKPDGSLTGDQIANVFLSVELPESIYLRYLEDESVLDRFTLKLHELASCDNKTCLVVASWVEAYEEATCEPTEFDLRPSDLNCNCNQRDLTIDMMVDLHAQTINQELELEVFRDEGIRGPSWSVAKPILTLPPLNQERDPFWDQPFVAHPIYLTVTHNSGGEWLTTPWSCSLLKLDPTLGALFSGRVTD